MASLSPAALEADRAEGKVQLIVDDDEILGSDLEVAEKRRDGASGFVHVPGRNEQDGSAGRRGPDVALEAERPRVLQSRKLPASAGRELVDDHAPRVVARGCVLCAGISQADRCEHLASNACGAPRGATRLTIIRPGLLLRPPPARRRERLPRRGKTESQ